MGDVLAEGIYGLLDQGRSVFEADEEYWHDFLHHRRQFIQQVMEMVQESDLEDAEKRRRIAVLKKGSLIRLADITPALCVAYLQAWATDRERWQDHLGLLPTGLTPQQALGELTAPGKPALSAHVREGKAPSRPPESLHSVLQDAHAGPGDRHDQLTGDRR